MTRGLVRKPGLAGAWYPRDAASLRQTIEACYASPHGPGTRASPASNDDSTVIGILSPHAGLTYSGGVAATGYHALAAGGEPGTILLVGSHGGFDGIIVQGSGAWESPLGSSPIDETLARELVDSGGGFTLDDRGAIELSDNTFELQLPFIHDLWPSVPIVPVLAGTRSWPAIEPAARALAGVLAPRVAPAASEGKRLAIVVSTDLTHYGPHFGFMPARGKPVMEQNAWVKANDSRVLKMLVDTGGTPTRDVLDEALAKHNLCCPGAVALAREAIVQLRGKCNIQVPSARLLKQATSYDVEPRDGSPSSFSAVGYASVAFHLS